MKIYFPSYYNKFRCKADKCHNSCCVGWEIYVDDTTLERYKSLGREDILCHIDGDVIKLCDGERCPFLRADGLCRLISELGDEYTSEICREHPRFYHKIGDRIEGGIGASCEEAASIILTSDNYAEFACVNRESCDVPDETELDTLPVREEIYRILSDRSIRYDARIAQIREKHAIPEVIHTKEEWQAEFDYLEFLNESHRELIGVGERISGETGALYLERFLAYLVFRHVSTAEHPGEVKARVAFCLLLAEILENYIATHDYSECEIIDAARIISEEIEYSEDNTNSLILELESLL